MVRRGTTTVVVVVDDGAAARDASGSATDGSAGPSVRFAASWPSATINQHVAAVASAPTTALAPDAG
jgi:hypothetical protein